MLSSLILAPFKFVRLRSIIGASESHFWLFYLFYHLEAVFNLIIADVFVARTSQVAVESEGGDDVLDFGTILIRIIRAQLTAIFVLLFPS